MDTGKIDKIIDYYRGERTALISILQEIQDEYGYLPKDALVRVADKLKVPLTQVFGVATFYTAYSLEPRGRHQINVCLGTACHVKGGDKILEEIKRKLGLEAHESTTKDLRFTVEPVHCLGCCSLAPVMVIDDDTYGRLRLNKITRILQKYENRG